MKETKSQNKKNITIKVDGAIIDTTATSVSIEVYSTFDVCRIVGVSKERFREWIIREYVRPSRPADGQGTRAEFSINDVYRIAIFKNLIENGFSREKASKYIKSMTKDNLDNINSIMFIQHNVGSSDSKIECLPLSEIDEIQTSIIEASPDWDSFFIVNLQKIKKAVTVKLTEIKKPSTVNVLK